MSEKSRTVAKAYALIDLRWTIPRFCLFLHVFISSAVADTLFSAPQGFTQSQPGTLPAAAVRFERPEGNVINLPILEGGKGSSAARDDKFERNNIGLSRREAIESLPADARGLIWQRSAEAEGRWFASFAFRSPGAEGLRVGLSFNRIDSGILIKVAGLNDRRLGHAGHTMNGHQLQAAHGASPAQLVWTPVTDGDFQAVELSLPADASPPEVRVENLSHLFARLDAPGEPPKLLSCHVNYNCTSDPVVRSAGRSVARVFITRTDGSTGYCSGALINDAHSSAKNYFVTANHCVSTASEAANMQYLWFFDQACGGTPASLSTSGFGAQLLYTARDVDFTMVRLTGNVPGGITKLGWDGADVADGAPVFGVHHPAGSSKAVSSGVAYRKEPSMTYRGSSLFEYWTIPALDVRWSTGLAEGGSSGSPIMSSDGTLRAILTAGPDSQTCASPQKLTYGAIFSHILPRVQSILTDRASLPDEPDTAAQVTVIRESTVSVLGELHSALDQDWFRFVLPQRGTWTVRTLTEGEGVPLDTVGRVYSADGRQLLMENDDATSSSLHFRIQAVFEPGVYFVQVTGRNAATGRYVLSTNFIPEDDHSNSFALAATLVPGANVAGAVDYPGDTDHFAINVPAAGRLTISSSGSTDVIGVLYDNAGLAVTASDNVGPGNPNFSLAQDVQPGRYVLRVLGYDVDSLGAYRLSSSFVPFLAMPANHQGAWWAGEAESGWGLSLVQHGSTLVASWYFYDAFGQPIWYVMPGCSWNTSFTTCSGNVLLTRGAWLGSYAASALNQSTAGTVSFNFSSTTSGSMSWSVNGFSGQKAISRVLFSSGSLPSGVDYSDVWWGGAGQNGWGVALLHEGSQIAGSWYTFNPAGQPEWYLFNGGTWITPNQYTAGLFRYTGAPLIGAVYTPAQVRAVQVGSVTLNFTGSNAAVFSYTINGLTQSKTIGRLPF